MQMGTYTFAKSVRPIYTAPNTSPIGAAITSSAPTSLAVAPLVDDHQMSAPEVIDEAGCRVDRQ